jgi:hypothetical protein
MEDGGMNKATSTLRAILLATAIGGISMNANGADIPASWKEEALLHDGNKITVERSQTRGPSHYGQQGNIDRHVVSFFPPSSTMRITWESKFGEVEAEKSELLLLAIDVVGGVPYLVTTTAGCLAYNRWKRPNPPYVVFRFDGKEWQRIPLTELPKEIKEANVVIGALTSETERQLTRHSGTVAAAEVRKINTEAYNPEYLYLRVFVREPIKSSPTTCEELVYYKGAWVGPGDSIGKRMMDRKSKASESTPTNKDGDR